jgi:hypothetical protein
MTEFSKLAEFLGMGILTGKQEGMIHPFHVFLLEFLLLSARKKGRGTVIDGAKETCSLVGA